MKNTSLVTLQNKAESLCSSQCESCTGIKCMAGYLQKISQEVNKMKTKNKKYKVASGTLLIPFKDIKSYNAETLIELIALFMFHCNECSDEEHDENCVINLGRKAAQFALLSKKDSFNYRCVPIVIIREVYKSNNNYGDILVRKIKKFSNDMVFIRNTKKEEMVVGI